VSDCNIISDGKDIFVVFDGVPIATRGHPGTSEPERGYR
jgi:hypothetical protein